MTKSVCYNCGKQISRPDKTYYGWTDLDGSNECWTDEQLDEDGNEEEPYVEYHTPCLTHMQEVAHGACKICCHSTQIDTEERGPVCLHDNVEWEEADIQYDSDGMVDVEQVGLCKDCNKPVSITYSASDPEEIKDS